MERLNDTLRRAFEAAAIPPARWGKERLARLEDAEREFYLSILRSFAAGSPPSVEALCDKANELDLAVEETLAKLAREDLVHHDQTTGAIVVAYPFSGRPTPHRVHLGAEAAVNAMCAIDALGIPFMLETAAEIVSLDPVTGAEVWVRVDPGDGSWWGPKEAVVAAGGRARAGRAAEACCAFVNFFASSESAERYLGAHPDIQGVVISVPEAIEAGRLVFGELLEAGR
jgi:hypothetical protein